jgi:kynureninase
MRLALALPIFAIEDDIFNAAAVAAIVLEDQGGTVPPKMVVYLNGNSGGLHYPRTTVDAMKEFHTKSVSDWKAALSKLYE